MRAIDADKLKDLEELEYKYFSSPAAVPFYEADKVCEILEAAPTITYADLVPHGRWERVIPSKSAAKWSSKVSCSVCHKAGYERYNFCPNCGAKMEGQK